jgi:hypothetical protein
MTHLPMLLCKIGRSLDLAQDLCNPWKIVKKTRNSLSMTQVYTFQPLYGQMGNNIGAVFMCLISVES